MLTQKQYERLPGVLQKIVDLDREREASVFPFARITSWRQERGDCRNAAASRWGFKVTESGGPVHA